MLTRKEAISALNLLGKNGHPFSFYCDFLGNQWQIESGRKPTGFQLEIADSNTFIKGLSSKGRPHIFKKKPIAFDDFRTAYDRVVTQIKLGNSFLTNLTFETPIETDLSLEQIFQYSYAKYKLLVPDQFVVFSPETFVRIENDCIYSYPMKGTIDAELKDAEQIILNDTKEKAEHVTIVDLIRNDLSRVATSVEVTNFRYVDKLTTNDKNLLQVSSEICGQLSPRWKSTLGTLLSQLLPAGSISGAPKPETISIIQQVENRDRGFYTGICGHFDGETLDTGVMIRFIKKQNGGLVFCSGGGITSFSEAEKEYQEMVDKVYLPF